ncbi:hypothetical protein [Nocardia paucivorans]|uniref:hypothetical protein n=1 Tax=Nocardia paucivorans TaxID=114259 RepID=UPI00030BC10A|nr:hypothetical protein [Nocardia paucivorans]
MRNSFGKPCAGSAGTTSARVPDGNGRFIQCPAVDRHHFNEQGLTEEGETLYDAFDVTQRGGVLPRDDTWQFRALPAASKIPAPLQRFTHRTPPDNGTNPEVNR